MPNPKTGGRKGITKIVIVYELRLPKVARDVYIYFDDGTVTLYRVCGNKHIRKTDRFENKWEINLG